MPPLGLRNETQNGECGHALAAAGLTDDAQRLALAQIEGDAVHRPQGPFPETELDVQIVDLEQR